MTTRGSLCRIGFVPVTRAWLGGLAGSRVIGLIGSSVSRTFMEGGSAVKGRRRNCSGRQAVLRGKATPRMAIGENSHESLGTGPRLGREIGLGRYDGRGGLVWRLRRGELCLGAADSNFGRGNKGLWHCCCGVGSSCGGCSAEGEGSDGRVGLVAAAALVSETSGAI